MKLTDIRDNEGDSGDVIVLPEGAELDVAVNENGITLTLPNVDLRMRCLGEPTAEGYCLLEAGTTGGGGSGGTILDSDGDGVPDADEGADDPDSDGIPNYWCTNNFTIQNNC